MSHQVMLLVWAREKTINKEKAKVMPGRIKPSHLLSFLERKVCNRIPPVRIDNMINETIIVLIDFNSFIILIFRRQYLSRIKVLYFIMSVDIYELV